MKISSGPMTWEEICEEPLLQNLPFKIEQDRFGRVLMSPAGTSHARRQAAVCGALTTLLPGWDLLTEVGVATAEGVRVPDVAAVSPERRQMEDAANLEVAPDICVEVLSPRNSDAAMQEKRQLFAAGGCREFWLCHFDGAMTFLDAGSGATLPASRLCPAFPSRIG